MAYHLKRLWVAEIHRTVNIDMRFTNSRQHVPFGVVGDINRREDLED